MAKRVTHMPNLQNIPIRTPEGKPIRDALLKDVVIRDADYSEIERRIMGQTND